MELNDLLLKKALLDAAEEEFADILDGSSPDIRFTKKYLSHRRQFLKSPLNFKDSKKKTWKRITAQAAILVFVLFSLMLSARFTVFADAIEVKIVSKLYKDHLTYTQTRDYIPAVDAGDWYISSLPEGFTEHNIDDTGDFCSIHYVNGAKLIELMYFHTSAYMNISMKGGNYIIEPCTVNGEAAIFHRSEKGNTSSVLMWFSEDGELVFMLDAILPAEQMIEIAESVKMR